MMIEKLEHATVISSAQTPLKLEIVESETGFEIRALSAHKLLIKPIASNAIELRPSKY